MRMRLYSTLTAALLVLAGGAAPGAQQRIPTRFSGLISDFTPAHDSKGNLTGPWVIHGNWRLDLQSGNMATFVAALTMEHADSWFALNPAANPDDPTARTAHTHDVVMRGQVSADPSGCPTVSDAPATTTGFVVTGSASVTGNGQNAPFAPNGELSPLTVCVTGGADVEFANVTLVFGTPASKHFGQQPLNGAVLASY